ncbi:MAG: zinc-binding alcohol dehydrogenase family protein [Solirubrobacterales bacterium]
MKAVAITAPGSYEVLDVIEREVPEPGPNEVRIAVAAAAVNPTDSVLRTNGNPAAPAPWTPGMDAAGVVDAVGAGVERLQVGESVMAVVNARRPEGGAQAEQLVVPEDSAVPIPEGASLEQASTLPMNGLTARVGLETLDLSAGETVAVGGGAGLLARYAIALAKTRFGLRVIADAKPEDEELVRSYGADVVVPRSEDFAAAIREVAPDGADGVFDTAQLNAAALGAVRDGGAMVTVRGWVPEADVRGIEVTGISVAVALERSDWLEDLSRLAATDQLQLRVDSTYPPEQVAAAQEKMDAGGLRGRCVIVF